MWWTNLIQEYLRKIRFESDDIPLGKILSISSVIIVTDPKSYMEWIFWKIFGIARIYGPGTTFSTGGRIKILLDFKFL